jgi:site-specific recombinase XerD
MKAPIRPNGLARALRDFFADHLPRVRGLSGHTIHSYRDSLVLLLRYVASQTVRNVVDLDVEDIGTAEVLAFLAHIETDRHNSAATRNVRLSAIHAFFRHLASAQPDRLDQCQRILAVPFKRARQRTVEYLEYDEIEAVLAAVDRTARHGARDYALLVSMFNTGARVQEIIDIRYCDLQLVRPLQVRLLGKGRKERICPLWPETAEVLRAHLADQAADPTSREPVFLNHRGGRLTRFGVRYILNKYCAQAGSTRPPMSKKRLHPHSMRHSTAVHLLRSGVDMVTISHWLGHASVNTTNRYAAVDLKMKRDALAKAKPIADPNPEIATWRADNSVLDWLQKL